MFPLSRNFPKFAAAGALVALSAATTPASAGEMYEKLGPVGPRDPILMTVGSKRVIAFYAPHSLRAPAGARSDQGLRLRCAVQVVVWNPTDVNAESTVSFKATVNPGETASIDSAATESFTLRCGDHAETLTAIDSGQRVVSR